MRSIFFAAVLLLGFASTVLADIRTYDTVPQGFETYTVQPGDTWLALTGNEETALLAMKVNRVDAKHVRPGMQVLLPVSSAAQRYVPVPEEIMDDAPRHLVVYLDIQYFGAYERGRLVHWGPVSSGKNSRRTIVGSFQALWKDRWHRSSRYGNARMYYAVQFSGNYFTHEQVLPGYPASHGCVRMLADDASWKFAWIEVGDPMSVVQSVGDVTSK